MKSVRFICTSSLKIPQWEWCGNYPLPFLSLTGSGALKYQEVHQEPIPPLLHE